MTQDEINLIRLLGEVYNSFVRLPREHPNELDEAISHIHALQRQVMARPTRRNHPEIFLDTSIDNGPGLR